ncbi:hypothetical protein PHMEG_00041949 [Phytophthora megakarya]|uniref:Uncharacterized protein n=1 Tax=Phytophthora megakarya TaxID=4795 RepID=A0A225UAK6_9STRA|nr:hypothetical protein PHMEG_00041949 [Phytophthora megakarya]
MTTILGPEAINEEKFTVWESEGKMLGLMWNIPLSTLAMPQEKILKALSRINGMLGQVTTTQQDIRRLLGSLRHVVTCIPSAKSFFQQLSALLWGSKRYGATLITPAARDDLMWFRAILLTVELNSMPLSRFSGTQPIDYEIYMDASDAGLFRFRSTGEGDYNINLRERMSTVFASLVWGQYWSGLSMNRLCHVRFWIDNTSTISWHN